MNKIYIASSSCHGARFKKIKDVVPNITSSWLNEYEIGATSDWSDLWKRCIYEASTCDVLIVYKEKDDILRGALVEVGAALANNKPVFSVGCQGLNFLFHPLVTSYPQDQFDFALRDAINLQIN